MKVRKVFLRVKDNSCNGWFRFLVRIFVCCIKLLPIFPIDCMKYKSWCFYINIYTKEEVNFIKFYTRAFTTRKGLLMLDYSNAAPQ